jgi:hypothetical protein
MLPFEFLFPWLFKLSNTFKSGVGLLSIAGKRDPAIASTSLSGGTRDQESYNPAFGDLSAVTAVPPATTSSVASKLQRHLDASGTIRRTSIAPPAGLGLLALEPVGPEQSSVHTPTSPAPSPALVKGGLASRVAFQRASPRSSPFPAHQQPQASWTDSGCTVAPEAAPSSRVLPSEAAAPVSDGTVMVGGRPRRRSSIERLLSQGEAVDKVQRRSPSPSTRRAFELEPSEAVSGSPSLPSDPSTGEDQVFAEDTRTPVALQRAPLGLGLLSTVTPDGKAIDGQGVVVQSPLMDVLWTPSHSRPTQARSSSVPPRGSLRPPNLRDDSLRAVMQMTVEANMNPQHYVSAHTWQSLSGGPLVTLPGVAAILGVLQLFMGVFMAGLAVYTAATGPGPHAAAVAFLAAGGPGQALLGLGAFLLSRKAWVKLGLMAALASMAVEIACVAAMVRVVADVVGVAGGGWG